jgi:hypothetical protein
MASPRVSGHGDDRHGTHDRQADLPVEAIARQRGLPVGTVKTRLAAARRRTNVSCATSSA